jgi:hypothetical protein
VRVGQHLAVALDDDTEPTTVSNLRWGLALLILVAWIDTTLGETALEQRHQRLGACLLAAAVCGTASSRMSTSTRITQDDTGGLSPGGIIGDACCDSRLLLFSCSSRPARRPEPRRRRDARQRAARAAARGRAQSDRVVSGLVSRRLARRAPGATGIAHFLEH